MEMKINSEMTIEELATAIQKVVQAAKENIEIFMILRKAEETNMQYVAKCSPFTIIDVFDAIAQNVNTAAQKMYEIGYNQGLKQEKEETDKAGPTLYKPGRN